MRKQRNANTEFKSENVNPVHKILIVSSSFFKYLGMKLQYRSRLSIHFWIEVNVTI